jgi:hypothetical protein
MYIYIIYLYIRQTKQTENGNFRLFVANDKLPFVAENRMENGSLFSLIDKQ